MTKLHTLMVEAVETNSREDAATVEQLLMEMDIVDATHILREFKKEDSKNYFEWAKLLKSKEIFKKIVAYLDTTGEIKEK